MLRQRGRDLRKNNTDALQHLCKRPVISHHSANK